jgi:hypothetical protein
VSVATLSGGRMYSCWRRGNSWLSHSARSKPNGDSNQRLARYLRPRFGIVANKIGFRNGPVGVKPPSDDLATVIVLPSVVDTRVATSCNQIGAGEPI